MAFSQLYFFRRIREIYPRYDVSGASTMMHIKCLHHPGSALAHHNKAKMIQGNLWNPHANSIFHIASNYMVGLIQKERATSNKAVSLIHWSPVERFEYLRMRAKFEKQFSKGGPYANHYPRLSHKKADPPSPPRERLTMCHSPARYRLCRQKAQGARTKIPEDPKDYRHTWMVHRSHSSGNRSMEV